MAAPVEVQYGITATGAATSASRVYASTVTAGHTSVVLVSIDSGQITTSTVTDSQGNAYTMRVSAAAANPRTAVWTAAIGTTGACTVTWTKGTGEPTPKIAVAAVEVSVSGGTTLGVETTASGDGAGTTPTTGNLVTSLDTLLLGLTNVDLFQTPSAGTGWTQRATSAFPNQCTSLIARSPTAGTYTANWSVTGSGYGWQCVAIALKEVSAAVTTAQSFVWGPV